MASEHELMDRFGVSRSIARKAIAELESRFLVRRVRGSGTYVNNRVDYVISNRNPPSLHSTIASAGGEVRTFLLSSDAQEVPSDMAELLGTAPGVSATRLTRLGYINGAVASYSEEWLAPGVSDYVDVSLGVIESLYEVLQASGHAPRRAWSRATTASPPAHIERRLELDSSVPTWVVETLTKDADSDAVLMASRTWSRQDSVRMVFEFAVEDG